MVQKADTSEPNTVSEPLPEAPEGRIMGCGRTIVKYLLFITNVAFLLAGGALLGVGIGYKVGYNRITDAIPEDYNLAAAPTACIVIGAIIVVTAFLGCCGAIQESNCMLITYGTILLLILIAQIAVGIYALVVINKEDGEITLRSAVERTLNEIFENFESGNNDDDHVVNYIQRQFECCGTYGPSFWGGSAPQSCCREGSEAATCTPFTKGCFDAFYDYLMTSGKVVGGVVIGLIAVEFLGGLSACCLARSVRRRNKHF